jgi:diguanylate cyclase (GGDEF)-like protein
MMRARAVDSARARQVAWRALAAATVWTAGAARVHALDPDRALTQYQHDVWQAAQGVPQSVAAVVQTKDGYLWLGTTVGLVRFDGVRSVVFDSRNTEAFVRNHVTALLEDRQGRLWIATFGGGLLRKDDNGFVRYAAKEGLPHDIVTALFEDSAGRLWVGTRGGGLVRLEGERFVRAPGTEPLASSRVRALAEDRDGVLWIGTETGLARLEGDALEVLTKRNGLSHDRILALLAGRDRTLWIGTEGGGLDRLRDGALTAVTTAQGLTSDNVWCLAEDRDGNVWIGTDGGGLDRLAKGTVAAFTAREGLGSPFVWALHEDREGSLWIGTNGAGLNRLRDGRAVTLTTREGLTSDFVRAIRETRDGSLWIGTYGGGLDRVADGRVQAVTTRDGLSNDSVVSLLEDRAGALWVGTRAGLNRLVNGRPVAFAGQKELARDFVYAILEDREGSLWIATNGSGVKRLRDGRITALTTQDGLGSDVVTALAEGRDGSLWIGTYGGGLDRLQEGRLTSYTTRDGLTSNSVLALVEDEDGALWIATNGGGLDRLADGRITAVTSKQGLYDDELVSMAADGAGRLWMGSIRGIFRVAAAELREAAEGKRPRVAAAAYGTADGIKNPECNGGSPSVWKDRRGTLWFSTMSGAVAIDAARLRTNAVAPPVALEEVLVDGRAAGSPGTLRLPPGTQRVELRYAGLSLVDPGQVRFKYRMAGFEPDWVDAGPQRSATYTNLPPGDYAFHVIASNNDGVWNEQGAARAVSVEPRLHERPWCRAAALIALAGVLYGAYRIRVVRLKTRQVELIALVRERTRELLRANEELDRLARIDPLTLIANRRVFDESLRKAWADHRRRRAPLALLLCDIDHFKAYNDHYGHTAGDEALRAVAQALQGVVRRETDFAARYGGEEFALLLYDTGPEGAFRVAAAALGAVRSLDIAHHASAVAPCVTLSIGALSVVPAEDDDAAPLVAGADRALYQAKADGRNRVVLG